MFKSNNYKYLITLFFLFYSSLIVGFYFDENLNLGAIGDWIHTDLPVIESSSKDMVYTILNYEMFGHRHSPVYLLFLGFLKKIGFSFELIRFFHLNLSLLLIYFFYKCLKLKFDNIEKGLLVLISFSIFLSPTFRSLSIWPSTRIIGLIFFLLSILEFLKYQKTNKEIHIWKNLIFLIISSYISPNFSVFIIFFIYHFLKKLKFDKVLNLIIFCFILSLPAFYYLFILDVNFLTAGTPGFEKGDAIGLNFNVSNKILIISSIILFHLLPFLINKKFINNLKNLINKKLLIFIVIFFAINVYFFNYVLNFTGGGIFYQISHYFLNNNLFFFLISLISLIILGFFSQNNLNNFLIFAILILSNIQNTIYHKYYDPLVLILFFTLMSTSLTKEFFTKKKIFYYLYSFYLLFICARLYKNYMYLNF